jgi:Lhr-like helicase
MRTKPLPSSSSLTVGNANRNQKRQPNDSSILSRSTSSFVTPKQNDLTMPQLSPPVSTKVASNFSQSIGAKSSFKLKPIQTRNFKSEDTRTPTIVSSLNQVSSIGIITNGSNRGRKKSVVLQAEETVKLIEILEAAKVDFDTLQGTIKSMVQTQGESKTLREIQKWAEKKSKLARLPSVNAEESKNFLFSNFEKAFEAFGIAVSGEGDERTPILYKLWKDFSNSLKKVSGTSFNKLRYLLGEFFLYNYE